MIFHSLTYLVFLVVVLALYWSLGRRAQNLMLLGASYVFYGWEHPWFLLPLWGSTLLDYSCAVAMERFPARRYLFLALSIAGSIGLLAVFKYAGFAVENLNALLANFGADPWRNFMTLALPAGLSFYTFQSIGYVVDVYRGRITAVRDLPDYALYVTFFPQLVAGPIERAAHMMPQYRTSRRFNAEVWRTGLALMTWGFFKKLVIADNTAVVANKIFALNDPSFPLIWAGVLAFAVQIYADFSAYTDIARGTSRLLGIELMQNFNHPYLATSPADFWRRWHISLSTWLRDYIYIPLGGNRGSAARVSMTLLATFAISGLWHGASWNYVLWGVYWGGLILLERALRPTGVSRHIPWLLKVAITFALACFGWLLFRERSLSQIAHHLTQSPFSVPADHWQMGIYFVALVLIYTSPLFIHMLVTTRSAPARWINFLSAERRFVLDAAVAAMLIFGILTVRSVATSDFIYFQF